MRVLLAFLLVFLLAGAAAFAQPECSASGVVVNSVTGEIVPRAAITIGRTVAATTDETGKWTLDHLPCGKVGVIASRPAFLPGRVVTFETAAGAEGRDLRLELTPQSAITGRIVDEYGDPVPGAAVTMKRAMILDGVRVYQPAPGAAANDIGEYRIPQLSAGRYLVCVGEQCSTPMTIAAGYNGVVDFRLSRLVPRQVRGKVTGVPDGAQVQLTLTSDSTTLTAAVGADGEFEVTAPPASYTILATTFGESDQLTARIPIVVGDRDFDDIAVHLDRPLEIAGTLRILSQGTRPDTSNVAVLLYQQPQDPHHSPRLNWNGGHSAFTVTNLLAGRYRLQVSTPPGFHVERIVAAGIDITDSEFPITPGFPPMEILMSDVGGTLEGTAEPDSGIIALRGNRHWVLRADKNGKFRAGGFPAGDYKVSAWDDLSKVPFRDEAWMEIHARAVSVTVTNSQSTSVALERSIAPDE